METEGQTPDPEPAAPEQKDPVWRSHTAVIALLEGHWYGTTGVRPTDQHKAA
jgi:hypothetical protein